MVGSYERACAVLFVFRFWWAILSVEIFCITKSHLLLLSLQVIGFIFRRNIFGSSFQTAVQIYIMCALCFNLRYILTAVMQPVLFPVDKDVLCVVVCRFISSYRCVGKSWWLFRE